ncbi:hypothetical protein MT356_20680 [Rathayibacter festucae]|uniref:hypothetical protein n=1 Tax=Rathayibacter festucae TaxID=110937 RepID=UPI001FB34C34|nr:hypothetical protein [Rathayibacter festucae]MCJ1702134.1 hypothetical protein [Rathayibacter festucae]
MKTDPNTNRPSREGEYERDARAWRNYTGMKYTTALRLMKHPLAQGILGERVSARQLLRVLTEHPLLVDPSSVPPATILGENGLWSAQDHPLVCIEESDYINLVLSIEVLRMFKVTSAPKESAHSYPLKHAVENYVGAVLKDHSYVSNGTLIWAAAALGLPVAPSDPGERKLNVEVGVNSEQVQYVRGMNGLSKRPSAHHHRPPGYLYLRASLELYVRTGKVGARWDGVDAEAEPRTSSFHEWLIEQVSASGQRGVLGSRETLAYDYLAGVADSDHRVARSPEDLLMILNEVGAAPEVFDAARDAVVDWARRSPLSTGIRTERIDAGVDEHDGWGAGAGEVERYEYLCPCRRGIILEEHDNIPGFREHDVRIMCDSCRLNWQFVPQLPVRGWRVEPARAAVLA